MARTIERLILIVILLVALAVRLYGLGFGLPYTIHPDEPNIVDRAVITIKTGDWNPHWFIYPSGYHYLQTGVLSLHLLWGIARGLYRSPADLPDSSHVITSAPAAHLWARGTTALLGMVAVLLVYLVGRRCFSRRPESPGAAAAGLAGALLLALSPLHVEHSHYVTADVPTATLAVLVLLLSLQIVQDHADGLPLPPGVPLLAGLATGVAGGFKYNGIVVLLPLLLALALRSIRLDAPERGLLSALRPLFSRDLLLALLGVALGYTLACPFTFADLPTFLDDLGYETHIYRFGGEAGIVRTYEVAGRLLPPWQAYAHALFQENAPAALAYLGGTVLALIRRRREDLLLLAFTWGYYLFLSSYGSIFVRNVLLALPGLAVLGGIFLTQAASWLVEAIGTASRQWRFHSAGLRPVVLALVLVAMSIQPGRRVLAEDAHLATPTSQRQARRWLNDRARPGDKVAAELHPRLFIRVPYTVIPVDYLSNYPLSVFVNRGIDYVVANSERYGPEFAEQDTLPEHYAGLLRQMEPVADFAGHTAGQPGPRLTIYRVPQGELRPQHPLEVTAGAGLRLHGFDVGQRRGQGALSYVDGTTARQPGEILALTLYLEATAPLPADYLVSVRLQNAAGGTVAWQKGPPCAGNCPPSGWTPGEIIVDQQDLPLSPVLPAGAYHLEVRFLHPETQTPLPVPSSDLEAGWISLVEIAVSE